MDILKEREILNPDIVNTLMDVNVKLLSNQGILYTINVQTIGREVELHYRYLSRFLNRSKCRSKFLNFLYKEYWDVVTHCL